MKIFVKDIILSKLSKIHNYLVKLLIKYEVNSVKCLIKIVSIF